MVQGDNPHILLGLTPPAVDSPSRPRGRHLTNIDPAEGWCRRSWGTTPIDTFFQRPQADSSHISTRGFPFRKLFFPFVAAGNSMKRCRFFGHFCLWHLANRQTWNTWTDPVSHQLQVAINFWAALWFGWPSVPECSDRSRSYLCKSFLGGIAAWNVCVAMCITWIKPLVWTQPVNLSPFWDSFSYLTLLKLVSSPPTNRQLWVVICCYCYWWLKNNPCFALGFVRFIPATISLQALDSASAVHIQRMKVWYDTYDTYDNTM